MLAQSVNHVTLDKARSPTKSERDSAVLEGLARGEGLSFFCNDCGDGEVRRSNPSGSRPNSFGRQHLTFDKGRAWMPEVERPRALQGRKANRAFISQA